MIYYLKSRNSLQTVINKINEFWANHCGGLLYYEFCVYFAVDLGKVRDDII
jgi:hypothetical protein